MAKGATLKPHFRDFLPEWVARQPWYPAPACRPGRPVDEPDVAALMMGSRYLNGPDAAPATGCLAVVRSALAET